MGLLLSNPFRDNARLAACAASDESPIGPGEIGPHVLALQYALLALTGGWISGDELDATWYGPTTATAAFAFNTARRIFRPGFVGAPDGLVSRGTLEALDREMIRLRIA